jgi:hypothetical protein
MCSICEDPNRDIDQDAEDDLEGLCEVVRGHGWVVKCVENDKNPYAYTIGLHQFGLPELLATGVTTERALALMDNFAPEALQKGAPAPGDRIIWADTAFEAVEVEHPDVHMGLGTKVFGPELRAVQLVWTDMCGRWPWDPRFDYDGMKQPVLGRRAQNA